MTLNKKPTTWEDIRSSITVLTQEEWDEIDLKVKIVGEILKARQDENLTQRALEELSGIKQPVIARIENGKTDPQLGTVLKILRPLGKTLAVVDMNRENRV
jgi:DNA-binding XRE family transcriptional regulator